MFKDVTYYPPVYYVKNSVMICYIFVDRFFFSGNAAAAASVGERERSIWNQGGTLFYIKYLIVSIFSYVFWLLVFDSFVYDDY